MSTWKTRSHAKINLGLHVLRRLENGYHEIETGFAYIEWSDELLFRRASRFDLSMGDSVIPVDSSNLIARAYHLVKEYSGFGQHYAIEVKKQIPAGAGLGGGSSNAAATLRALNKLESLHLSDEVLHKMARLLGADVPFFLNGSTGIGRGLGEQLEWIDIQPDRWIVTVFPDVHSATPEAYKWCQPNDERDFSLASILLDSDIDEWNYLLENDLEPPVIAQYEIVGHLKDQMYDFGADYASMSGSGSSVFGLFEQDFVALNAYQSLTQLGWKANLTRPKFKPDLGVYEIG